LSVAKSLELSAREGSTLQRIKDRIPTYLADFREKPSWLLMFLFGRTMAGRRLHSLRRRAPVRARVGERSLFNTDRSVVVAALKQDGLFAEMRLPREVTSEIQSFAETTGCFGNHDRNLDLLPSDHIARQTVTSPVTSGHYFERVQDCPAIMEIQADPLLHTVAADYLGPGSRVISTRLWWSFPVASAADKPAPREMLHFDLDDWRMLKYFFYLTPVDAGSGPHLYMRGSHSHHALKHQFSPTVSRPLDELIQTYGADGLTSIHGEAGDGFAEDSFGFHAGSLALTTPRLMLEIGFGVTPPNRRRFFGERVLQANAGS
jgi:hypothetical protein